MSDVTIVLNKEALDALFPEGSEARLKLASSAMKAFLNSAVKPTQISDSITNLITSHVNAAKEEALREIGFIENWAGNFRISPRLYEAIQDRAKTDVHAAIGETIGPYIEKALATLEPQLQAMLERQTERRLAELMKDKLAAAVRMMLGGVQDDGK